MWAAACGFWRPQGVGYSFKARSFCMSFTYPYVKNYVQSGSLRLWCWRGHSSLAGIMNKLESLIMAQNERWRHA